MGNNKTTEEFIRCNFHFLRLPLVSGQKKALERGENYQIYAPKVLKIRKSNQNDIQ